MIQLFDGIHLHSFTFFRLLIGAPEAESGQENVQKGGAVYKCPPDAPGRCDLIKFDTQGNYIYVNLVTSYLDMYIFTL